MIYEINTDTPNCLYSFVTDDNITYGVNLSRRIEDLTAAEIIFVVMNEEYFDVRHNILNLGDVYNILDTVSECVKLFMADHEEVTKYSFEGYGDEEEKTQRNTIYIERCVPQIFDDTWEVTIENNRVTINKIQD